LNSFFLTILIHSLVVVLLLSPKLYSQKKIYERSSEIADTTISFIGNGIDRIFKLPQEILAVDSIKTFPLKESITYNILEKNVTFTLPVEKNTVIKVYCKKLTIKLPRIYSHRDYQVISERDTSFQVSSQRKEIVNIIGERESYSNLIKGGSLTRGFSFGSGKGLFLNSGLRMQLSGKLSEDLEINASLTDQNTPLQPEGNTQTLQEIDKIFVQLKGKNFESNFGDYRLELSQSLFGKYDRKLQGIMFKSEVKNQNVLLSTSISEGDYQRNTFMGQEGNQGPYQLVGKSGVKDIIILAGTEKVWLDGLAMQRGEDNDYVIEYAEGQITFTRKRLITSYSRIEVDFQYYATGKFKRNLYAVQAAGNIVSNDIKYSATYIREDENKDNPIGISLSEEDKKELERIGDNLNSAQKSGIEFVGKDKGNYEMRDSLGTQIFYYAGSENGSYNIRFSDVGENNGEYINEALGIYKWVGIGEGRYSPVIILPAAQSHNIWDFKLEYAPAENFIIDGEIALSSLDLNRYSQKDDADNVGRGMNFNLDLKDKHLNLFGLGIGTFTVNSKYRNLGKNFREIDRIREVEFNRKWFLEADSLKGENLFEFSGKYQPIEEININFEGGKISKGALFQSIRREIDLRFNKKRYPGLFYKGEYISSGRNADSKWMRQKGDITYSEGKFQPLFNFEYENKKLPSPVDSLTGYKFLDIGTGLSFIHSSNFSIKSLYQTRQDDKYNMDRLEPYSKARTQSHSLSYRKGSSFTANGELVLRNRKFEGKQEDSQTRLADFKIMFLPFKGGLRGLINYQISQKQVPQKERVYFKVEGGKGNYIKDEERDEYIPDENGDYILRILPTDIFYKAKEVKIGSSVKIEGRRILRKNSNSKLYSFLKGAKNETVFRYENEHLDNSLVEQFDNNDLYNRFYLLEDLILFETNRDIYLRMRFLNSQTTNNKYLRRSEKTNNQEYSIRFKKKLTRMTDMQLDFLRKLNRKDYRTTASYTKKITITRFESLLNWRPQYKYQCSLNLLFSKEEDSAGINNPELFYFSIKPGIRFLMMNKGRLLGELSMSYVDVNPKGMLLPYEMADGNREGMNYKSKLSFEYKLSNFVSANFYYTGRKNTYYKKIYHNFRGELRAYF